MRPDPRVTIMKIIAERYPESEAVFWAGSVSKGEGTEASDLDLVIVYQEIPHAYREAFIYDRWPIDAFIHDLSTMRYFFEEFDRKSGTPALPKMILGSVLMTTPTSLSDEIKALASKVVKQGPPAWTIEQIDKARFFITDVLEDIVTPKNRGEQIASAARLYELLAEFYFRSKNSWCATGKTIVQYLEQENDGFSENYSKAFENVFKDGDSRSLDILTRKILEPYGGLLWDGFRSEAPSSCRFIDNRK